jgi:hypothetical protein
MISRPSYVTVQMSILVLPAVLAAGFASTTHRFPHPFETFWAFACGVSGMFAVGAIHNFFGFSVDAICTGLSIAFVTLAFLVFVRFFKTEGKRNIVLISVNAALAAWSVVFGFIWQGLAKQ